MKILSRYVTYTVLNAIGLVTLVLIGLFMFVLLVMELSEIGDGHYGIVQALHYVLLCLPQQIYQFFPMAALIGCLMGLGGLANHSELTVMRTAGVSVRQIMWVVLRAVLIAIVIVGVIGEVPTPWLLHRAQVYKQHKIDANKQIRTGQGTWVREGNTFIQVADVVSPSLLKDVTIYTFNQQHQLLHARFAKTAQRDSKKQWQLQDVVESQFKPNGVTRHHYQTMAWPVEIKPKVLESDDEQAGPENMHLIALATHIGYLKKNNLQYEKYAVSFWQRLLQPLATLMMILLAMPFIFGPLRTLPMGYRMMIGITIGFSFYILNQLFGPFSLLYRMPPLLSAVLPLVPFGVLSVVLIRRL